MPGFDMIDPVISSPLGLPASEESDGFTSGNIPPFIPAFGDHMDLADGPKGHGVRRV